MSAKRKLTITAHTIADLAAPTGNSAQLIEPVEHIECSPGSDVAAPYSVSNMSIIISELGRGTEQRQDMGGMEQRFLTAMRSRQASRWSCWLGIAQNNTALIYSSATETYTPAARRQPVWRRWLQFPVS